MNTMPSFYQPVSTELEEVERKLRELAIPYETSFPELTQMINHATAGGKRLRAVLNLLAGKFYCYDPSVLLPTAVATEVMHIATLVHDDAIDKASTRHGKLTVNELWGAENAILLGDYLFSVAGEFAASTNNSRIIKLFPATLKTISRGELKQSFNAFNLHQTMEDYWERIYQKTASLFIMATEWGAVASKAPEESIQKLVGYSRDLGVSFQVVDDILDFTGDESKLGKPTGSDLLQGTLTLPSLMLLAKYPDDNPIYHLFQGEDQDKYKYLAIKMVLESSIIEDCYRIALDYAQQAVNNLKGLPQGPAYQSLAELADYIVLRER